MNVTTVVPLATYRNETAYPFCPGCGHGPVLDRLNESLVSLQLDPRKVVLVSDIGCAGLSDQYFRTSAFHGLHGRSVTYATGIKLARPDLTVIVIMGDGGVGIGGAHLLSAARRNIGITLLVLNNFNYGMTGGQHSATTPVGAATVTTPEGNLERPLDICATVAANGAGFVYRGTSFDDDLSERFAEGIRYRGFSVLDVWELCTAHYVPRNRLSKKALLQMLDDLGQTTGVIHRGDSAEYTDAYRAACASPPTPSTVAPRGTMARFPMPLADRVRLVLAGAAGGRVGGTADVIAHAGVLCGLWAAKRSDFPITVRTGFSVAEVILSPDPVDYVGIDRPEVLVVLSAAGQRRAERYVSAMGEQGHIFTVAGLSVPSAEAPVTVLDPGHAPTRLGRGQVTLGILGAVLRTMNILPDDALRAAVRDLGGPDVEARLRALEAGEAIRAGARLA